MIYAYVRDGRIEYVGPLPATWTYNMQDYNLYDPAVNKEALGWFLVDIAPKPADTPTSTWYSAFILVDGQPVQTWYEHIYTAEELAEIVSKTNEALLMANPEVQIATLLETITKIQLLLSMTNAEINANPALVLKAMARESLTLTRRLIRIARLNLGVLDSADTGE